VRARKTGFLVQRTLRRKPRSSTDYPGYFINTLKKLTFLPLGGASASFDDSIHLLGL
jgi:hypothetical protein